MKKTHEHAAMSRHLLAGAALALLAFGVPASGQSNPRAGGDSPLLYIHYDYATKEITPLSGPSVYGDDFGTSFANTAATTLMIAIADGTELVDWGVKSGGLTGFVSLVEVAYFTDELGPVALDVALYAGTTGMCGAGVLGTEAVRLSLTGLPGDVTSGAGTGYIVNVDVSETPFFLADGPIGWGYVNTNAPGFGLEAFRVAVGANPTGTVDDLDLYTPAPATSGVCSSAGPGFLFPNASTYLRLEEEDGTQPPEQEIDNGSGVNPMLVGLGSTPPAVGAIWDPSFLPGLPGTTTIEILALATAPMPPGFILPNIGEILIDVTPPNPFQVVVKPPGGPFLIPIPLNLQLVGFEVFTQSLRVFTNPSPPGPPLISAGNRADVTIGL